jgi:hypothetical protein
MTVTVPGVRLDSQLTTVAALDRVVPPAGPAGVVLGFDRRERPVTLRVDGGEATRVVLVGGLRCAQLLAMRLAGVGLRTVVRSPRAAAWERFARRVNEPGERLSVAPDGPASPSRQLDGLRGTGLALRSLVGTPRPGARAGNGAAPPGGRRELVEVADRDAASRVTAVVILDTSPIAGEPAAPGERARVTVVVREELTSWDASALTWADVVILQRLTAAEADLAATALQLTGAGTDLTRLRPDAVALVSRGSVHQLRLRPTALERDLIGSPARD